MLKWANDQGHCGDKAMCLFATFVSLLVTGGPHISAFFASKLGHVHSSIH